MLSLHTLPILCAVGYAYAFVLLVQVIITAGARRFASAVLSERSWWTDRHTLGGSIARVHIRGRTWALLEAELQLKLCDYGVT